MSRVCGLDLSLTCCGVAICVDHAGGTAMMAETVTSKGARHASLVDRYERLALLSKTVLGLTAGADLAVIEGAFSSVRGASPIDRFGLFWAVAGTLIRREIPVAVIAPTSLKLAIAGKGNADKAALAIAVERLWPGLDVSSSDVSDAAGLAHLGAVRLGMDVPTLERHRTCKAEWPDGLGCEAAA